MPYDNIVTGNSFDPWPSDKNISLKKLNPHCSSFQGKMLASWQAVPSGTQAPWCPGRWGAGVRPPLRRQQRAARWALPPSPHPPSHPPPSETSSRCLLVWISTTEKLPTVISKKRACEQVLPFYLELSYNLKSVLRSWTCWVTGPGSFCSKCFFIPKDSLSQVA